MARRRERRSGLFPFLFRWIRRIQRVAMIISITAAAYRWWYRWKGGSSGGGGGSGRRAPLGGPSRPSAARALPTPVAEPELVGATSAPQPVSIAQPSSTAPAEASNGHAWVQPLEGGDCPLTHPIKANESSGIYHVPGGRFYDRIEAVRCYGTPEAATADGYRAAKA
jgi:hypothetical protein